MSAVRPPRRQAAAGFRPSDDLDFEQLIAHHKDAVYRQMLRVCGNQADAEDVLQDALLNAYRALGTLRDPAAFRAWLARIGRNACVRLRKRAALQPIFDLRAPDTIETLPSSDASAETALVRRDMDRCVQAALQRLPEPYRRVLVLRDVAGLSGREVAGRLGISLAAEKSRLHRARALLRTEMDRCFR